MLTKTTQLGAFVFLTDGGAFTVVGKYVITKLSGISDVTTATTKTQKVIENGQVLIIKDGKKYNLLGAEVK